MPLTGECGVYLIDKGYSFNISTEKLRHLTVQHEWTPPLAQKCRLFGVEPLKETWSPESTEAFEKTFPSRLVDLKIVRTEQNDTLSVIVRIRHPHGDMIVNRYLVDYGFAKGNSDLTGILRAYASIRSSVMLPNLFKMLKTMETKMSACEQQPYKATITHVDANMLVYVNPPIFDHTIQSITRQVIEAFKALPFVRDVKYQRHQLCLVSYKTHIGRGMVKAGDDRHMYSVEFIDFGYTMLIDGKNLRPHHCWPDLEPPLVCYRVHGICPPAMRMLWPTNVTTYMRHMLVGREATVTVVNMPDRSFFIKNAELVCEGSTIREFMLQKGLADIQLGV